MFEEIHNLPFYEILTLRKNKLNYIDVLEKNNENCTDELSSIGWDCYQVEPYVDILDKG